MGKIGAMLRLTRIEHSLMLVVAVLAAELIAGSGTLPAVPILAASLVAPIFISTASFAINDYFDVDVDRANRKRGRPLVSGELSKCDALYIAYASLAIGVFASLPINSYAFIIAAVFGGLAMLYSYKLKEMLLLGNLYIAFSMAIPFIYGSFVMSARLPISIALVSIMIFLSGLAREIHGTVRDYEGDRRRRVASLPRFIGMGGASAVAALLYLTAILISIFLFLHVPPFRHNAAYATPVLAADALLAYVSIGYMTRKTRAFYSMARNLSLAAMALALMAILAAPLVPIFL